MHDYRFSAREGQLLNARLDSPSPHVEAVITYISRDGVRVNQVDNPLQLEQQTLPHTGRYEIRVLQTRNGARRGGTQPYTLNISIVDPGASSAAAPNVVEPTPQLTRAVDQLPLQRRPARSGAPPLRRGHSGRRCSWTAAPRR